LFFYFLTGLNRIFIKIIKEILKYKKKEKIENFLFKKFTSIGDDRLIIKIKGEWIINGKIDIIKNKIKQKLINENKISYKNIEYSMP
jgi:LPS O-antigen subunit length determinant protein (WzzB/FepE family)